MMSKEVCLIIAPPETKEEKAYRRKILFLTEAMQEGAHLKPPPFYLSNEQWGRWVDIGLAYNLNEAKTLEEVGQKFGGITRERVRQIEKKFIYNLWGNSSPEVRAKFPLEKILLNKPVSQTFREKISASMGGASLRIKEQVQNGVTRVSEIEKKTGISEKEILGRRDVLRRMGIELPRKTVSYKELKDKIDKITDDNDLQEILDNLPLNTFLRLVDIYKDDKSLFVRLGTILHELGFSYRRDKRAFKELKAKNVPIKIFLGVNVQRKEENCPHNFYFVYVKHRKRIRDILTKTDFNAIAENLQPQNNQNLKTESK